MSKIAYDPVKDRFARIVRNSKKLRKIFYTLLDLFFLRSWHIRRILLSKGGEIEEKGSWKLLDAGSGFGQYDYFLLKNFPGISIDSVDVKEEYLEDNKRFFDGDIENGRIRFQKLDLLELDALNEFDMVICIDVLEHIENDVKAIRNLSRSLKRNGYFLMHSPSHYSEEDANGDDTFVGEHARTGYSKAEIEKKLMEADLLPIKTHYTYGTWGRRAWTLSVKWPMILFNRLSMLAVIPLLFYYPVVLPFCFLMNLTDLYTKNNKGNGIYALAKKI
ncbi:MAG: class I SAM-dependent methyltransferase [Balneolaceae bacterium]|nr:class I SAM-dependent methyltransferase [Balneolaceae bacterium]